MDRLDDTLLRERIFRFLGRGYFRRVAGTCKRFWRLYRTVDVHTLASELVQTVSGAMLFYRETSGHALFELPSALVKVLHFPGLIPFTGNVERKNSLQFVSYVASWKGRYDVVVFAHARTSFIQSMRMLVLRAQSDILGWTHVRNLPFMGHHTLMLAAYSGNLRLVQWALSQGFPWGTDTIASAALGGHLDVVQWARLNGCPWDSSTCDAAARGGHLHILQWAIANKCPWGVDTCHWAAYSGHLDVVRWAHEYGFPRISKICYAAAQGGQLHMLQWARQNRYPWDASICIVAARNGHLHVVQWAHEHGCPWNAWVVRVAREEGHHELADWAIANGCPE